MRRLWAAAALIAVLAGLSALHVLALDRITSRMAGQLEQARQALIQADWDGAQALIEDAYQDWETHDFYLHVTLRHTDIDAVRSSFHEAIAYLSSREDSGECAAVCARLVNQLELILEGELPTLKNLL